MSFQEEGKEYQVKGDQFNNPVPHGLASLEHIFYRNDINKNNIDPMKPRDYIEINIGTNNEPKMIKIWKRYFWKGKEWISKSFQRV